MIINHYGRDSLNKSDD